jgi:hypothetical protein
VHTNETPYLGFRFRGGSFGERMSVGEGKHFLVFPVRAGLSDYDAGAEAVALT